MDWSKDDRESGNWNVAADFTKLKIMKWLFYADEYEVIATFGTAELGDDFEIDDKMKKILRVKAIERLTNTLLMIINNTIFAVKSGDKEKLEKNREDLKRIKKILPTLQEVIVNQRVKTKDLLIDEERFSTILNMLVEIKTNLNEPLNKADLIFTSIENFDPKKLKEQIKRDLIEQG